MTISKHEGNWAELRRLVLRLLEEHEEVLDQLSALVQGAPENRGLVERVALLEEQIAAARAEVAKIDAKSDAAHKKINQGTTEKKSLGSQAALVAIIGTLAAALGKLIEVVINVVGGK